MDNKRAAADILKERLTENNYSKLFNIDNLVLHRFVAKYIEICNPDSVFISTNSPSDIRYIKEEAVRSGEEIPIAQEGHTVHFDGYYDQGRDAENTKFFLPKGLDLGPNIKTIDKDEGLKEITGLLKNIMRGHRMYVQFFCLGPLNSPFSMICVQLTDSSYVAHSQNLLYRQGYEEFNKRGKYPGFFKFVHSEGVLEKGISKNVSKRRVYIDTYEDIVYSVNTQYGGNTLGHKKLAMRLAINRASEERWLTEHMFLMGIHGPKGRISYFTGAFPSMCGKTSTAMVEGETLVGDDIVYLREINGQIRAVNVENGIFGIIQGVNAKDDPVMWKALNQQDEIIFSNVLLKNNKDIWWTGKNNNIPQKGVNYSGEWFLGKKDAEGKEIPPSHKNARVTINLHSISTISPELHNPLGVKVSGIIYGGRDSNTWVPVEESFNWAHGIITKGASLESETTAAALGKEGVRKLNPMANLAFLSIPIGRYIENNLAFGANLNNPPVIFSVNYFLKDKGGHFLNERIDKKIWLKWMELRSYKEIGAVETPTGYIPKYDDLRNLFKQVLDKFYSKEDYTKQFTLRVSENIAKIDRTTNIYKTTVPDTPQILFSVLEEQKKRLADIKKRLGNYITPDKL